MPSGPRLQLLWWEGCPSTEPTRELVSAALDSLGRRDLEVRMVEVASDEQARQLGFRGSPTILIDGVDMLDTLGREDPDAGEPAALTCRLYRRRDGRVTPMPDPADVHEALALALDRARRPTT